MVRLGLLDGSISVSTQSLLNFIEISFLLFKIAHQAEIFQNLHVEILKGCRQCYRCDANLFV